MHADNFKEAHGRPLPEGETLCMQDCRYGDTGVAARVLPTSRVARHLHAGPGGKLEMNAGGVKRGH